MRVRLHNAYTRAYAQIMQHRHMHKAVTGRDEAKKLLSHRRQSNYSFLELSSNAHPPSGPSCMCPMVYTCMTSMCTPLVLKCSPANSTPHTYLLDELYLMLLYTAKRILRSGGGGTKKNWVRMCGLIAKAQTNQIWNPYSNKIFCFTYWSINFSTNSTVFCCCFFFLQPILKLKVKMEKAPDI